MIKFNNISKKFGQNQVLTDVNINLEPSSLNSFLGPNGSGKTTLIKIFLGLVKPDTGNITDKDENILENYIYKENIGYMTQIANYPDNLTASDLMSLVIAVRSRKPVMKDELISLFKLEDSLKKPLKHLSGGTKQKVNAVIALMFDCPILVLDEPTVGLDPQSSRILKDLLIKERSLGKTILLTSHILQDVEELSDKLNVLIDGKIVYSGNKNELISQTGSQTLEDSIIKIYTAS
ncbi:MAG: ABC transporter ATP-binding protein [Candidatus Kapabacteria bacterium]|jgi:Cu-processing system ATP-binding protein|nr:ABC transporter ATP-binding protein [Candidatus Kapabacteria bacterium]